MSNVVENVASMAKPSEILQFPESPEMRLETYFLGNTNAIGIFQDRWGKLRRQFYAKMVGCVEGDKLHLGEELIYDDGELETRNWTVTKVGEDRYEGTCENVVGKASGSVKGNVFRWTYRFRLGVGGRQVTVDFDDAMYLQAGNLVINRVKVSKFGIRFGEATIVFFKDAADLKRAYDNLGVTQDTFRAAAE